MPRLLRAQNGPDSFLSPYDDIALWNRDIAPIVAAALGVDDISGDTSTNRTLTINGASDSSAINASGDTDWFRVELVAGQSYVFSLTGSGAQPLLDPFLEIRNASGTLISIDDDGGDGVNASMQFTALQSGTYYLSASGVAGGATGEYTISAATGAPQNPLDTLDLGFVFNTTNIVVYFATTGQNLGPEGPATRNFTGAEQAAVMSALQTIADVTNLAFTTTTNLAAADFVFSMDSLEPGLLGVAYPSPSDGYIVFNQSMGGWAPGGLAYSVIIHESLHALGLGHPHYDGYDNQVMQGVLNPFGSYGSFGLNQQVFTIMSYNDGYVGPNGLWQPTPSHEYGYSATPMALDIAFLQMLYGADPNRNSGDTVYTLSGPNPSNPHYVSIWDTGGIDTIAAVPNSAASINLNAATLVYAGGYGGGVVSYSYDANVYGGFTIAHGVVIENAVGGDGGDTIVGNEVANILTGNGGDDTMSGGAGADTLLGGDGNDVLDGGVDADTLTGGAGNDRYLVSTSEDTIIELAGGGTDRVDSSAAFHALAAEVEILNIVGAGLDGAGNDLGNTITGNDLANVLAGGAGGDFLTGLGGDDQIDGGSGDDVIHGQRNTLLGTENNSYLGGDGFDLLIYSSNQALTINLTTGTVTGGFGADTFTGFEAIAGGNGGVTIIGSAGDDRVFGGQGVDIIDGGAGIDTLDATISWSQSRITVDLLAGAGDGDTIVNIENVVGTSSNDSITGDHGVNRLEGGEGMDLLAGNGGDDTLVGGDSSDILEGGGGADVLEGGAGSDTISYESASGPVTVDLHLQTASGNDATGDVISSFEDVIGSAYDDLFISSATHNWFTGGSGNDTVSYENATEGVVVNFGLGTAIVGDVTDTLRSIESVIGSAFNDQIGTVDVAAFGGAGDDVLVGGFGSNLLDGGSGADQMSAYVDDDVYIVDHAGDVVNELADQGVDTVRASISYTLAANVENLVLIGSADIGGAGNGLNNTLTGNSGANTLSGGDGADTLNGGLGVDVVSGGAGNDTILYAIGDGNGVMNGGDGTDALSIGDGAAARILNVTWNGAALTNVSGNALTSIETITANLGGGVDWLVYAAGSAAVTVNLATGSASGFSSISNIERVVGGNDNDTLTGNGIDNRLDGGAGDDTLAGGGGIDTLIGGDGVDVLSGGLSNDSIQGGAGNDTISWSVGDGRDTIDGGADADTFNASGSASAELGNATWNGASLTALMDNGLANIEAVNLDLGGGIDWLIYNASAAVVVNLQLGAASGFNSVANIEKVIGGSGNDTLTGDGLDNRLDGLAGNDTLDGGAGSDAVLGGDGDDTIYASAGNDSLQGQNGDDTFIWTSTDGRDTFNGGADTDTVNLTGSAVADVADANWNGSVITGLLNNALVGIENVNLDLGAGGAGGDWLRYNTASGISVDLGAGAASGFASITGVENLIGGTGNDDLTGDGGVNKINGANGDDVITGGGGNDNLTGGAGSDTFVYAAGAGNDTIIDFDAWDVGGQDFLDVSAFGIDAGNFAARVAIIDTGADTVIRIDNTYFITLKNVSGDGDNVITQDDFIFGP